LRLLRRSAEEHILLGTFDHLAFDDRAVQLFFHYLWASYSGPDDTAPDAGTSRASIDLDASIHSERERYASRASGINAEYWASVYGQMPEDRSPEQIANRGAEPEYERGDAVLGLNRDSAEDIRSAVAGAGVSMFTAYVSVFAWTAFNLTKRETLAIYVPLDNRRPADRWVIGNFACVRPVIIHRTDGIVESYLEQVAGQLLRSLTHRHLDGASEHRVETGTGNVRPRRGLALNYMRADGAEVVVSSKTGLTVQRAYYAPIPATRSATALVLAVRDEPHAVRLNLQYTKIFLSAEQANAALSSCVRHLMGLSPQVPRNH
jgi:hypothetical protein